MGTIQAVVFDAYGTLFDVHSVIESAERAFPGYGERVSRLWRSKQLEYTWLRSLAGAYTDFWNVTRDALIFACRSLELDCPLPVCEALMAGYLHLHPYPDVEPALQALSDQTLAVLSNGSPAMLAAVIKHAGLDRYFSHVWSVDKVRLYKPAPQVYALAPHELGIPNHRIGFVTANYFDVFGAKAFGFQTYWLNRSGAAADELGPTPDRVIRSLEHIEP